LAISSSKLYSVPRFRSSQSSLELIEAIVQASCPRGRSGRKHWDAYSLEAIRPWENDLLSDGRRFELLSHHSELRTKRITCLRI
jgi:hypothetical protein